MPLKSDSVRSATYINNNIAFGDANRLRDEVFAFHSECYRTHSFGIFESYYGAGLSLGYYGVSKQIPYNYSTNDSFIVKTINERSGKKFFGSYGVNSGIAIVVRSKKRKGEWRILGLETSFINEFGQYLKFRKNLPDSVATANMNSSFLPTVGITTEFVGKLKHSSIGYKFGIGLSLKNENGNYRPDPNYYAELKSNPGYVSQTFYYTRDAGWTLFYQSNFGSHTWLVQTGFIQQLGRKK